MLAQIGFKRRSSAAEPAQPPDDAEDFPVASSGCFLVPFPRLFSEIGYLSVDLPCWPAGAHTACSLLTGPSDETCFSIVSSGVKWNGDVECDAVAALGIAGRG
jgi:hypothetical protein